MATIIGNTTTTPMAIPDWNQTDATKADYIKNKPVINKSLIFDTKTNLDNWMIPCKNLFDPSSYVDNSDGGIVTVYSDGRIYLYASGGKETYAEAVYTFTTTEKSILSFAVDSPNVIIQIDNREIQIEGQYNETLLDAGAHILTLHQDNYGEFNVYIQLERGDTATEYEPCTSYIRQDGFTKDDLQIGDLLLIQEANTPDYYWNGSEAIEIEAKGSIDGGSLNLSNYYTKEEIDRLITNRSSIQIITWEADD